MTPLDDFLNAGDLDDLLKARRTLGGLTAEETQRVTTILSDWQHGQAISNLLFHPSLIPESKRYDSIDRALSFTERPYFILATVVGLQSIDPETVPIEFRKRWVAKLLEFVQANGNVLSSRASVTIRSWLHDEEMGELIRAYPVANETATDNIMAVVLARFGQLTKPEFRKRLQSFGLGYWARRRFLKKFDEYQAKKASGQAIFMTMPLLSHIPNYRTIEKE